MRSLVVLTLLASAALAGCIGGAENDDMGLELPEVPLDWALRALTVEEGHNHSDVAHHQDLSTPNFRVLGWDPLVTDFYGESAGAYYCGDVADSGDRRIAVVQSLTTGVSFVMADVTDPSNPVKLSDFAMPRVSSRDVATVADASFVVVAGGSAQPQGVNRPSVPPIGLDGSADALPAWTSRNLCGETVETSSMLPLAAVEEHIWGPAVFLVDTRDPTTPKLVDLAPQPGIGVHSIHAKEVDGTYYVLASTTNLANQASYFMIFTVEEVGGDLKLVPYGTWPSQAVGHPDDTGLGVLNGHVDGWIAKHPRTGDTLAYLAGWDAGLIIVKLEGPGRLTQVGNWNDHTVGDGLKSVPEALDFSQRTGQVHTATPLEVLWDDKHYTFIGQELIHPPPGRPSGQIVMLDTTDPERPWAAAFWTLPVDVEWGFTEDTGLLYSTHYVGVVNRTLFVAMYHGGVWAVDASSANGSLPSLGVFIPDRQSPQPPSRKGYGQDWAPLVMEALPLSDGNLLTYDGRSGVYVLNFDPMVEVPVPEPWPLRGFR